MNNKKDKIDICEAKEKDIKEILKIQKENIISPEKEINNKNIQNSGFLIYAISEEELKDIVRSKKEYLLNIAKEGEKCIGYFLIYNLKTWGKNHSDWIKNADLDEKTKELLKDEKIAYGRHIALTKENTSQKVGKRLLERTIDELKTREYKSLIIEILKSPITNNRSLSFAKKENFEIIGESKDKMNRVWYILIKKLN